MLVNVKLQLLQQRVWSGAARSRNRTRFLVMTAWVPFTSQGDFHRHFDKLCVPCHALNGLVGVKERLPSIAEEAKRVWYRRRCRNSPAGGV